MSDNSSRTDNANPYAAPGGCASFVTSSLPDGRPFLVEGDALICPAKVDLSRFCFQTGEAINNAPLVFRRKIVVQCTPTTFLGKFVSVVALFFLGFLLAWQSYSGTFARLPFPSYFVPMLLMIGAIALWEAMTPKVVIQSAFSLNGDNAYASSNKLQILCGFVFATTIICTTFIVFKMPQIHTASSTFWIFSVMAAAGVLLTFALVRSINRPGNRGQLRVQQSATGVFRVQGLAPGLLRSLSEINA